MEPSKCIVRHASHDDFDGVLECAEKFFSASGYADLMKFDANTFKTTFDNLLIGDGVCIVAELGSKIIGIAGAVAYPFYFNSEHKTGQEMFWWINEEHRKENIGSLVLKELEEWARGTGCKTFSMISLESLRPESVGKLYVRAGYRASEHSYIKEL